MADAPKQTQYPKDEIERRRRYMKRLEGLRSERSSWDATWREKNDVIQPRRARFFTSDRNQGARKDREIINSTPTYASRVQAAGMMAGITSPARPWFRLGTPDPDLNEFDTVRRWLHVVEERIRAAIVKAKLYKALAELYLDLGTPGTAALYIEENFKQLMRGYVFPIGSYFLANGADLEVNTIYREFSMTTAQLVERFGKEHVSQLVLEQFNTGDLDKWHDVVHVIEPNLKQQPGVLGYRGMPFVSCYFEKAGGDDVGFLRESGYEEFPVMCPRWSTTGEDVYGTSSADDALGDCNGLQVLERRKGQIVNKMADPPMRVPSSLMHGSTSLLPGGRNVVSDLAPSQALAPAQVMDARSIEVVGAEIQRHEIRIERAFHVDLWLMLSRQEGQITATEVLEKHKEKLLQLGPVMNRVEDELLDPMISRVYAILERNGHIPEPPEEIAGMELKPEYISIMAQAQKLLDTTGINELARFVGGLSAGRPDVIDKLNADEMVDEYANALGVKPDLVRSDEEVAQIRQARAQAKAQAAAQQQTAETIAGAKVLSETDTAGDNALTRLLSSVGSATGGVA